MTASGLKRTLLIAVFILMEFGFEGTHGQSSPVMTFDSCGATGRAGPTQQQCYGLYDPGFLEFFPLTVINGIQYLNTPYAAVYRFQAFGASGTGSNGGKGAFVTGDFPLPEGARVAFLVGQQGEGDESTNSFAGSGGSFVYRAGDTEPMLVAGGGGHGVNAMEGSDGGDSPDLSADHGTGGTDGLGGQSGVDNFGGGGAGFKFNGQSVFATDSNAGLVPARPFLLPDSFSATAFAGFGGYHQNDAVICYQGGFGGGGYAFPGSSGGGGGYSGGAGGSNGSTPGGGGSYVSGMNSAIELNHSGPGKITFQILDNGMETTCGEDSFTIVFYRAFVYGATAFFLNDPNCTSTSNETHVSVTSRLNECGTTVSFTDDAIQFGNVLRAADVGSTGDTIARHRIGDIPISCSYPIRDAAVISLLPDLASLNFIAQVAEGDFRTTLSAYNSSDYGYKYKATDFPISVTTNQDLHLEIALSGDVNVNALEMTIESCFASPSANRSEETDIRYAMIEDRCVVDATLQYLPSPNAVTRRFRMKAFRFAPANFTSLYFHCQALLCNSTDPNSHCKQGCQRTKRSTSVDGLDSFSIFKNTTVPQQETVFGSLGPFIVKDNEKDDASDGSPSNQQTYIIVASSVAGVLFVLLVSAAAYVIHVKRVAAAKSGTTRPARAYENEYCDMTE